MVETAEEIKKLYLEYENQNIEMPKSYIEKINENEVIKEIVNNAIHNEELKQKIENIYENYKEIISMDSMQSFVYGYSLRSKTDSRSIFDKKWECLRLAFLCFYYIIN